MTNSGISFFGKTTKYITNIAATKDAIKQNWNISTTASLIIATIAARSSGSVIQIVKVVIMRRICYYSLPSSLMLSNATNKIVTRKKLIDTTKP